MEASWEVAYSWSHLQRRLSFSFLNLLRSNYIFADMQSTTCCSGAADT